MCARRQPNRSAAGVEAGVDRASIVRQSRRTRDVLICSRRATGALGFCMGGSHSGVLGLAGMPWVFGSCPSGHVAANDFWAGVAVICRGC